MKKILKTTSVLRLKARWILPQLEGSWQGKGGQWFAKEMLIASLALIIICILPPTFCMLNRTCHFLLRDGKICSPHFFNCRGTQSGWVHFSTKIKPANLHGCRWDGKTNRIHRGMPNEVTPSDFGMMVKKHVKIHGNVHFVWRVDDFDSYFCSRTFGFTNNDVQAFSMRLWSVI